MNELLVILRKHYDDSLPKECRTLCRTPIQTSVSTMNDGNSKYYYYGIESSLKRHIDSHSQQVQLIDIDFNVDGIGVSNSSTQSLLPLLLNVACHAGISKPSNINLYLKEFTLELRRILTNGLSYLGKSYMIKLRLFSCDAVARADVLSIKHHNGIKPCHKCHVRSIRYKNRQIFTSVNFPLRTSDSFASRDDDEHQKEVDSAFDIVANIIDIPKTFAMDYMHCVLLGIMKKLLQLWIMDRGQKWSLPK